MNTEIFLVRSETIAGFSELVESLGGSPEMLYRQVGFTTSLFENPDFMLPYVSVCKLMNISATALNREDFALLLADVENRNTIPTGALGLLMLQCHDVRAAIIACTEHFHLHSQGVGWNLEVEGAYASVTRADRVAGKMATFQYTVLGMAGCLRVLKLLCGEAWAPSAVSFTHSPPINVQDYHRFFGVKVEFNQEFTRFVFPSSSLTKKIPGSDIKYHQQLDRQIEEMETLHANRYSLPSRVKLLIQKRIHSEDCTQITIAEHLSVHPKNLQRNLNKHGTTFRKLRAEVRLDMAERYLKDSDIPITSIAELLGFSELSGFNHTFKTRHNISPSVWRSKANRTTG